MLTYVTSGAWGSGTGTQNSAAQVDANFYTVVQRIADVVADVAEGKRIADDGVTTTNNSITFEFTDGSTQTIALPFAELHYAGAWANSTPFTAGQLLSVPRVGIYQVLVDHMTPASPAVFDPDAVSDDTDAAPLYSFLIPLYDVNYDAAIFAPGSVQRDAGDVLFQAVAGRSMRFVSGSGHAYAYLDVGNDDTAATDIILSIQINRVEIGTITFAAHGSIDTYGGQLGAFNIPASGDIAETDKWSIRVTQSDNANPSGLSITLPFLRTDI